MGKSVGGADGDDCGVSDSEKESMVGLGNGAWSVSVG